MPGKITDSKMKYEGVQTTNKTMRVYNFAHWDGCWCIYIEWSTSIYKSNNLIVKILEKIQLVRNYRILQITCIKLNDNHS